MPVKIIQIEVPEDKQISNVVSCFTPEENYLMIKIGSECIIEGRKAVTSLTQDEIYQKLKNETRKEVEKLERDLLYKDTMNSEMEIKIKNIYESQIENYKKQLIDISKQLEDANNNNMIKIQKEIKKETEKYEIMYKEKEKQVDKLTETYEKLVKQNEVKSSTKLGDKGEEEFEILADVFKDFEGYKIENKSKQGHKGDFHLFFKKFNVLVDSKNYMTSVQKKELIKIENDLIENETMDFAWLISLRSNVSDYNKYPIMFKWVNANSKKKCIIIVNNLYENNPESVLRNIWSITNELNNKLFKENNLIDTIDYVDRDNNLIENIKMSQKRIIEMRKYMTSMSQTIKDMDRDLINTLELLSNEIVENECIKYKKVKEWWNNNIEYVGEKDKILTSTELWNRFKKDEKEYIIKNNLLVDVFKEMLKGFIELDKYMEKNKGGLIEFMGFKFKDLLVIENVNSVEHNNKKVKKIKKKIIISDDVDNSIVEQYNANIELNILDLSKTNNLLVWQIVSILMNNGIITKRSDARGYELYKETEEYKSKIAGIN